MVDQGGFTSAATVLGMTQSGVSQALRTLEDSLGVPVVVRGRSGITVTEIGQLILSEARVALHAVEHLRAHCAGFAGLASGTLRLASVTSSATRLLPDLLRQFRNSYPGISIVLLEGTDEEVCEWVRGGVADLGLAAITANDLRSEFVLSDEFVAVLPRGHRLGATTALSLAALAAQPFIMSGAGCEPMIRGFFAAAGLSPRVAFTVRDMATLFEMVRQRHGVTMVPKLSLPEDRHELRIFSLSPTLHRTLVAVTRPDRPLLPAVEAFRRQALKLTESSSDRKGRVAHAANARRVRTREVIG